MQPRDPRRSCHPKERTAEQLQTKSRAESRTQSAEQSAEQSREISRGGGPGAYPVPRHRRYRYTPGVGVWRAGSRLMWSCPTVTAYERERDASGRVVARWLTIRNGGYVATVAPAEVVSGRVWAGPVPCPGASGRVWLLTMIVFDQASRLDRVARAAGAA